MAKLFELLVDRRWLVLVLAFAALAGGAVNLLGLAIDAVPDISPKQVLILTEATGLGPLEVERLVTFPIESQMTGLPLLKDVRSKSRFGLSAVYVTFEDGANVQTIRAQVFERLQAARAMMPPGVGAPVMGPLATGLGEILEFELRGPGYTQMQLYQMLQWRIVPQLRLVTGVTDVNIYGGDLQTYEVQVAPARLSGQGLSLPDVFSAIQSNNTTRGGAYIERGDEQQIVRGLALAQSASDIAAIVIKTTPGGVPIKVGDVAVVRLAPKARLGAVTHDGDGTTIVGVVDMQYGLNSSDVLPGLKARIAEVQKQLPKGAKIQIFYDRSDLIQRAIHTVAHNLVEGALLVVAVLVLMLGNFRAGLIVAAVIPLSMVMAFAGMRALGISGNLMSLGALDFGLVVDGAVVLIENVLRRQTAQRDKKDGEGGTSPQPADIIPAAAAEVARPVIFSVLIIMLVYLPVLALQDVEGKTFRPMAITVMLALGSALLVTMLVIPALGATFLSSDAASHETFLVRWARRGYTPLLKRASGHPWITAVAGTGLLVIAAFLALQLGGEFIPQLSEGAIVVTSTKPPSINLDASVRIVGDIERVLRSFPDVATVVSQTGSAATPTDPMGVQSTDSYVILKPQAQWTTAKTQPGLRDAMQAKLTAAIPGVSLEFSQPIQMRMDDLLQGVRSDVGLAIYGKDLDTLKSLADKAVGVVRGIKGAADVRAEQEGGLPALTIQVNRTELARQGVSAADVLAVVEAIGGYAAGTVYGADDTETPIIVRLAAASRASAADVRNLPIGLPGGRSVPLSEVADISVANGPAEVTRDGLRRRVDVDINVRGRDIQSFVTEAQRVIPQRVKLPRDYSFEWSGMFQNLQSAVARLEIVVPAVLALIFMLLYLNFGSLRLTSLIFLNVPIAATGGIIALTLRSMPFSVTAGIGFIATFGVAILDGVVLVSYIEQERAAGKNSVDAAREAAEIRLRPVLTTALVASIGFLPMAVSTSAGAEVQRPLATVVIGGLVTATLLTLLVLPALYPLIVDAKLPRWMGGKRKSSSDPEHNAESKGLSPS